MIEILSKISNGLHKVIDERYSTLSYNNSNFYKIYINKFMFSLTEDIPHAVPLNDSINISLELISYNPNDNPNIEAELLAAGIKIGGRRIQNKNFINSKATFYWNLNFTTPGRQDILFIFREINTGYKSECDIYSRSIMVRSFMGSYRDLSILLAIISTLLTISTIIIKFFFG